jgi:hypothetical protein
MAANINLITGLTIQGVNVAANNTPLNINLQGITLGCTAYYYDNFFQATTSGVPVPLPGPTVYVVYVRNLGPNPVIVNYMPVGEPASAVSVSPVTNGFGGVFFYMQTAETSGGITAVTLTTQTVTTSCEVLVAY